MQIGITVSLKGSQVDYLVYPAYQPLSVPRREYDREEDLLQAEKIARWLKANCRLLSVGMDDQEIIRTVEAKLRSGFPVSRYELSINILRNRLY